MSPSTASNLSIVQGWTREGRNNIDPDAMEHYFSDDFVGHDPYQPVVVGKSQVRDFHQGISSVFPDIEVRNDDSVEQDDMVCCRYTAKGTHSQDFMGIKPSGRSVTFAIMATWRIRDGKITDVWQNWDALGMHHQMLGDLPQGYIMDPANSSSTDYAGGDKAQRDNCANVKS